LDEDFDYFLAKMGPPIEKRDAPPSRIERYRGKLPDRLLDYWQESGWCGYGDGLFWTVDPHEYEPVLEAWIGDTPLMEQDAYHIIARSAFGKLYFWGEKTGYSLQLFAPGAYCFPAASRSIRNIDLEMQVFFGMQSRKANDYLQMFSATLKKLGPLKQDELYGFVPALAFGGESSVDHLEKVKAVEHLVLLAQPAPLEIIADHRIFEAANPGGVS